MEPSNLIPHLRIICNMNASITEFSCVLYSEKSQQWDSKREGVRGGRFGHVSIQLALQKLDRVRVLDLYKHTHSLVRGVGVRERDKWYV